MQRPIEKPAGTPVENLDTPALIVDLNRLDANFAAVPGPARAEVWVHGTPAIARRQLSHPMVFGIAVRSIGEAEVFAAAGFDDIRILRPLVTEVSNAALKRCQDRFTWLDRRWGRATVCPCGAPTHWTAR